MIILGVGTPFPHDPSAAILVDGKIIAAADEERFVREKHAQDKFAVEAVKFCLREAKVRPADIDIVAYPWSFGAHLRGVLPYVARCWRTRPSQALKVVTQLTKAYKDAIKKLDGSLSGAGIDPRRVKKYFVEHHLAHASSAYHLSGMKDCAIMSIDGAGEFTSTFFAKSENGNIKKIKEVIWPDSLGLFYSTITEYLGFEMNDGEYKVMGMAPFGDPSKVNMSHIIRYTNKSFYCNDDYVWVTRSRRYDKNKVFSKKMVEEWGVPRCGDGLSEPYIHIAAAAQKVLEDITIRLMEDYLTDTLRKTDGRLCFAGGVALNVKLNKRLLDHPLVKELFVQPASNDSGTALGAATYAANELGEKIEPMTHAYLGPEYADEEIKSMLDTYKIPYEYTNDIVEKASELLAKGEIVAWFQGRMEYGPRALGNRSILASPSVKGISDKINEIIKFREKWRPFCPSILKEYAKEIIGTDHPSPYMTLSFTVNEKWRDRIKEVVHVDNTARPQIVDEKSNPKFYKLLQSFHKKTGLPALINTSLNRRGEPMVCSPEDALVMFYESGLQYLVLGNFLIDKERHNAD